MIVTPLIPGATASLHFDDGTSIVLGRIRGWARALTRPSDDLELVLTELVSNAREHGIAGPITVSVEQNERSVIVVVTNSIEKAAPAVTFDDKPPNSSSRRGRGLHITSVLSNHLTVEQGQGNLTVTALLPVG